MSERASGIILACFFSLMFVGIQILSYFNQKKMHRKKGTPMPGYDERQKTVIGKGHGYALLTILIFWLFDGYLAVFVREPLFEPFVELSLAVVLGLFVHLEYIIWNDAFMGIHANRIRSVLAIIIVSAFLGAIAFYIPWGRVSVDGKMDIEDLIHVVFVLYCINCLTALVRRIYLRIRDRE